MHKLLQGQRIVLTRPAGQSDALAARIRAAGGEVLMLPLLAIAPPQHALEAEDFRAMLSRADEVIFISPNAVRMALQLVPAQDWPGACGLVAVGAGTARVLQEAGLERARAPAEGADSEAVLAMPEFQSPLGRHMLLVRGEGGRELLAQTLIERGAVVEHAVVYRRVAMPPDVAALQQWGASVWVITSSEALRVLLDAARDDADLAWLHQQHFVFAHPRIARQAAMLGLNHGMMAPSPEDGAVFAALVDYARNHPHSRRNTP